MNNVKRACGCAVVAMLAGCFSGQSVGQVDDGNPFGPTTTKPSTPQSQITSDPFGPSLPVNVATAQRPEAERPPATIPRTAPAATPQPAEIEPGTVPCHCLAESGEAVAAIKKAIAGQLHRRGLHFEDTPLEEVVIALSTEYGIPIQLDIRAMSDAGQGPQDTIKVHLTGITFRSGLNQMLRQLNLTFIIQDELLIITTPVEAEKTPHVCVYDVRSLMTDQAVDDANGFNADGFNLLIDLITSCIDKDTWVENGGSAEIRMLPPGMLVITQTDFVHEQIRELLGTLGKMNQKPLAGAAVPNSEADRVVTRNYPFVVPSSEDAASYRKQLSELLATAMPDQIWNGKLSNGQAVMMTILSDRIVLRHRESAQREVKKLLADAGFSNPYHGGGFGGGGTNAPDDPATTNTNKRPQGGGFFDLP